MEEGRIPNRLKRYRRLAGYSQKEACEILGLHTSTPLSRWEKGRGLPTFPQILKLSALYRTHPIHLYQEFWQYLKQDIEHRESMRMSKSDYKSNQKIGV
jgi:transcriptional regulator with XRE-family HTH domain